MEHAAEADAHLGGHGPDSGSGDRPGHPFIEDRRDDAAVDNAFVSLVVGAGSEGSPNAAVRDGKREMETDGVVRTAPKATMIRSSRKQGTISGDLLGLTRHSRPTCWRGRQYDQRAVAH